MFCFGCFSSLLQFLCGRSAMLPGYGFSPFPDFQSHLHSFRCRGEMHSMWIPGPGESQGLSESQEGRRLLHPCRHKHVAVCQQETLAFIELQTPAASKLNGFSSPRQNVILDAQRNTDSLPLNGLRQTLNEINTMQKGCPRTDREQEITLNVSPCSADDGEHVCQKERRTSLQEQTEKPQTVTTLCRPLHAALSLPLSFPLSSLYTNRDSWESQGPGSPSSPECSDCQGPDPCQPQRRTSQKSLREKSIRELTEQIRLWENILSFELTELFSCPQGGRCRFILQTA